MVLDSGANINIFNNAEFLTNIKTGKGRRVNTTASSFACKQIGQLCEELECLPLPTDGYHYRADGIANLLSLAIVSETKRVVMDTKVDNAFYVFNTDGSYVRFGKCEITNLYCLKVGEPQAVALAHVTVEGQSAKYSNIDTNRALAARNLQEILASPSNCDLANAVDNNVIGRNGFTRRDIKLANEIYGRDVAALKRKTTKKGSKMQNEDEVTDLPAHIIKNYSSVSLYIDVMHVNRITFLIGTSKHIGLIQCVCI